MIFIETTLKGAYIVEIEKRTDHRGFFARAWCQREFEEHGLSANLVQANLSYNTKKGTLRGMHFQNGPFQETKLVRCTRGAIHDVIIDLRSDSFTFGKWIGMELSAENHTMLYVPKDFAHGFQTLVDDTEVTYQVTEFYTPLAEGGLRYDDPAFGIVWPLPVSVISDKDNAWPNFNSQFHPRGNT